MSKKFSLFLFLGLCLVLLSSCTIKKNIEDITDNANQILEELADLSRTVNSAVNTGELEDRVGGLIDDRIDKLSGEINELLQEGGGFLFDEVNGTLDNTFDNVRSVIDDIKTGILDESLPRNIELLSQQLVLNTNNIAAHAESLINLTFGNTAIVISQATDAAFTLSVWGIFGIGMVLFILFLIVWGSKMNKNIRNAVFGLVAVFAGVCLSVLFVTPVKAKVLQSLNVGEEMVARSLEPKIISTLPLEFEFGTDRQLTLFGTHLDSVDRDKIEIALYQSGQKKMTFPNSTLKVITPSKIILSDFANSSLQWKKLNYKDLSQQYRSLTNKSLPNNYESVAKEITIKNMLKNPVIFKSLKLNSSSSSGAANARALTINPSVASGGPRLSVPLTTINPRLLNRNVIANFSVNNELKSAISANFSKNYGKLLKNKYKILPGDYEIRVTEKETGEILKSVQHVEFNNPPPPPPKPDLFPIGIGWSGGIPVKGEKAKLSIIMGVSHGEEAKTGIKLDLSSNPAFSGLRDVSINRSVLNNANQTLTVQSKPFTVNRAGNTAFTVRSDSQNKISESNEGNNVYRRSLRVRDYSFKAVVKLTTFTSLKDLDDNTFCGDEEYRIDIDANTTGHSGWHINFNKGGAKPNKTYKINKSRTYNNLKVGDKINVFTSGYEAGDCLEGDESMGSATRTISIKNSNSKTHTVELRAKHYIVRGEVKYEKVILN